MAPEAEMVTSTAIVVDAKPKKGKPPLLTPFTNDPASPIAVKKVVLVYNPVGGRKKAQKLVDTIVLPMLAEAGIEVVVHRTTHAGHEAELGRTVSLDGIDALVGMGGDGTLSQLLTGFFARTDSAEGVAVGFLPAGTGNTYMREVLGEKAVGGCESGVRAAVRAIIGGRTRRADAFKCSMTGKDGSTPFERYALNTVMLGFGTDANAVAERRRFLGPMRYDISIKTEILKLPCKKSRPCKMTLDSAAPVEMDLFLIAFQNNKHTGVKHRVAPLAQLDDGLTQVIYTPKPVRSILTAAKLDAMVSSGGSHIHSPIVASATASTALVETPTPAQIMLDGDVIGLTPLRLDVVARAFTLLTPASPLPS